MRVFELLPEGEHVERVTVGRTMLRREGWNVPAGNRVPEGSNVLTRMLVNVR
jgi:hypothetical protein